MASALHAGEHVVKRWPGRRSLAHFIAMRPHMTQVMRTRDGLTLK
jgi:hypothetical protein